MMMIDDSPCRVCHEVGIGVTVERRIAVHSQPQDRLQLDLISGRVQAVLDDRRTVPRSNKRHDRIVVRHNAITQRCK